MQLDSRKILYAIYDLQIAPLNFDILHFLALADGYAHDQDYDAIQVIFVPFENDDRLDLGFSKEEMFWRFQNISIPALNLFHRIVGYSQWSRRDDITPLLDSTKDNRFPRNYDIDQPVVHFLWSDVVSYKMTGGNIGVPMAAKTACDWVNKWIGSRNVDNRKVVTLSLREGEYGQVRNSNLKNWIAFAHYLKEKNYFPILVRDTVKVFDKPISDLEGIYSFPEASLHLHIRQALYLAAEINVVSNSGAMTLCFLNPNINTLVVKNYEPEWQDTSVRAIQYSLGIELNQQLHTLEPQQRLGWIGDDVESLIKQFNLFSEDLDNSAEPKSFTRNLEDIDTFFSRLFAAGNWSSSAFLLQRLRETEPDSFSILKLRQLATCQIGLKHFSEAKKSLGQCLELVPDDAETHSLFGDIAINEGDTGRAETAYKLAITCDPENYSINLKYGMLSEALGNLDMALHFFEKAKQINGLSPEPFKRIAGIKSRINKA